MVDKGLIATTDTSVITEDGRKCNGNLMYTICPIHEVVEEHCQQQFRKLKKVSRQ